MKKYLLLLPLLLAFASCSDDKDEPASDELTGSCWSQTASDRTDTFYFALGGKCTVEWKYEGFDRVMQEYRYTFKSPNVTIVTPVTHFTYEGHIENNVLYIHLFDRDLALQKIR